ncbi:stress-related protein-like [Salvia miltiorrhiza]|uniref:stress-related protein-like n=1 Tax=Salvia miltiorrhiza TaxID=226208 RepID=UPI0025ABE934|nr:stress-related protein-like [Salvia miltiorrhiza]XP_057776603.1 stress-related protein-like [Salvia miltiorrhiza]
MEEKTLLINLRKQRHLLTSSLHSHISPISLLNLTYFYLIFHFFSLNSMAEPEATPVLSDQPVLENEEKKLKYLDFVLVAAAHVVVCFSTLYEYAKENSGPLRPGVQTVEGTVRTVIGPVYEKFHNVPSDLLRFVDRKVDESVTELDHHVPVLLKQFTSRAWAAAQGLASEVQREGLADTASNMAKNACVEYGPTAKALYADYEPVAEQYAVAVWRALNDLPLFAQVAHIMVPTAAHWAEKYNQSVADAAEKGYALSHYFPMIPVERIAKMFGAETEPDVSNNVGYVAVS